MSVGCDPLLNAAGRSGSRPGGRRGREGGKGRDLAGCGGPLDLVGCGGPLELAMRRCLADIWLGSLQGGSGVVLGRGDTAAVREPARSFESRRPSWPFMSMSEIGAWVGCGTAEPPCDEEGAEGPESDEWADDTAPEPVTGEKCPWLDGKAGEEFVMDSECFCATAIAGAESLTKGEPPSIDGRTDAEPMMGEESFCCDGDMAAVA